MEIAPLLSFQPKHASLQFGVDAEGAKTRSILFAAILDSDEDVQTETKRSLRDVSWTINLLDTKHFNDNATKQGAIGFLSHIAETRSDSDSSPESCLASMAVEPNTFASLFNLVGAGLLPDSVAISVKGMTYGWDPDGSEKIWDTQASRTLPILELSIRLPIAATPQSTKDEIESTTHAIVELQGRILRHLKFLIALASAALLVILFR